LRDRFNAYELDHFYHSFAKDAHMYGQMDVEAAQILIEMVDPKAFKVAMIMRKKAYFEDKISPLHG
jgi:hypothetical protein